MDLSMLLLQTAGNDVSSFTSTTTSQLLPDGLRSRSRRRRRRLLLLSDDVLLRSYVEEIHPVRWLRANELPPRGKGGQINLQPL